MTNPGCYSGREHIYNNCRGTNMPKDINDRAEELAHKIAEFLDQRTCESLHIRSDVALVMITEWIKEAFVIERVEIARLLTYRHLGDEDNIEKKN